MDYDQENDIQNKLAGYSLPTGRAPVQSLQQKKGQQTSQAFPSARLNNGAAAYNLNYARRRNTVTSPSPVSAPKLPPMPRLSPPPTSTPPPPPTLAPPPTGVQLNNPYSLDAFGLNKIGIVDMKADGKSYQEKVDVGDAWNFVVQDVLYGGNYSSKLDFLRAALNAATARFNGYGDTWRTREPLAYASLMNQIREAIVRHSQTNLPPAWS